LTSRSAGRNRPGSSSGVRPDRAKFPWVRGIFVAGLVIRIDSIEETPRPFRLESDAAWWERVRAEFGDREAVLTEPFAAEIEAYRLGLRLLFRGRVTGLVRFLCSRCGEPLDLRFSEPLELLLEPAQNPGLIPEGGIELDAEDFELGRYAGDELDFGPVIQEIVALAWPMQPLCSEDCAGLCSVCGAVRSRQACACETRPAIRPFAGLGRMLEESRNKKQRRRK
jgi:uncharacterized protein